MSSKAVVLAVLLLTWTPITGPAQVIAYVGPVGVVLLGVLVGTLRLSLPDVVMLGGLLVFALAGSIFYSDTGVLHPLLGLLTYGSALLLAIRFRNPGGSGRDLVHLLLRATAWLSIFQGALGAFQLLQYQGGLVFTQGYAGDYVVGTLGTNSHLYAVKMLFQGLVLAVAWRAVRTDGGKFPTLLLAGAAFASIGALLASAMLATLSFLAAFGGFVLWRVGTAAVGDLARWGALHRSRKRLYTQTMGGVLGVAALISFFMVVQPGNARLITETASAVLAGDITPPKLGAFEEATTEVLLADRRTLLVGTGLGRYSSRAAMILSGGYLSNHPAWLPVSRSDETQHRIYPRWNPRIWASFHGSIIGMPTSSAQSVLIEFGLMGLILMILYVGSVVRRAAVIGEAESLTPVQRAIVDAVPVLALCLAAVSFSDLWLEYSSLSSFIYLFVAVALSMRYEAARNQRDDSVLSFQA